MLANKKNCIFAIWMMKYLIHIWLTAMLLASMLVGCNRVSRYDSRLAAADSLLSIPKQRAAALDSLERLDPGTLNTQADRAYHSLLLTQARYLNYIVLTSDSDINAALQFYQQHPEDQEKRARAYIYKGVVQEDLGRLDSAMTFFKIADVIAGENDPFNRGYARLRMGKLYANHHAYDGRDIEKLEQALVDFTKCGNTYYQTVCLNDLGALYRPTNTHRAEEYLNKAIALAQQEADTSNVIKSIHNLAYLYFMQGEKEKSKDYFRKAYKQLQRIKHYGMSGRPDVVYTTFASVYANLGKPDSALIFLAMPHQADSAAAQAYRQSNSYYEAKSQIAKAQGNLLEYFKLSHQSDSISFSLISDPDIVKIMNSEIRFDERYKNEQEQKQRTRNYISRAIAAAIILALLLLALLFYRRAHRYDKLVLELKDRSQSQINDLADLQGNINELKINDERLKAFITSHMGMMREMIEACYHEPNNRIAENMKRIVKFQDSNKDNWVKLYDYIDLEHNNIMTRTHENYPDLNDKDLLLLALTCMGYSYIHIAIIMGYSNATSVSVLKQRLAKKMGLGCSLNEYIQNNGIIDN